MENPTSQIDLENIPTSVNTMRHITNRNGVCGGGRGIAGRFLSTLQGFAILGLIVSGVGCSSENSQELSVSKTTDTRSFDQWKESARVHGMNDVYVGGDKLSPIPLVGNEEALNYYEKHYGVRSALIIDNGQTAPGTPVPGPLYAFPHGATLNYCIDRVGLGKVVTRYGLPPGTDLYSFIQLSVGDAASAWSTVSGLTIQHNVGRDDTCTPGAGADDVTWYIQPTATDFSQPVPFLTFVLAPKYNQAANQSPPGNNKVLFIQDYMIQWSFPGALHATGDVDWTQILTFPGLMARAMGNALGFIDESNRVTDFAGTQIWDPSCRDPSVGGIYLSDADQWSVTLLPEAAALVAASRSACLGARASDFAITYADALGAACQYQGGNNYAFYCFPSVQAQVRAAHKPGCSPVPLVPGDATDCDAHWSTVSAGAQQFAVALIAATSGNN